jgi:SOS response regulatory protein OraA/RecX
MKWFGQPSQNTSTSDKTAERCIDYLNKPGEKNEKWAAVTILLSLISKKELSNGVLKKAILVNWRNINMRIGTIADSEVVDFLIEHGKQDQSLYANLLYNKNITESQISKIREKLDDSDRGLTNKKLITRKFGSESSEERSTDKVHCDDDGLSENPDYRQH